ncbi:MULTISPECIES: tetratricopeptide repeat protein [Halobacteriovorax]|uniref:Tetratricopeptide repeat protein n=1 Tax=Halobacteriovorax vibrionivorans TaxID=2152716 RepID=A0ABY0IG89_9BACT|nr:MULTISPECIES: tetratricopeptide repeat protein [Halobacteriovorax]AYF44737.1 tetratricopeptide repeat protein [Halobacteriovorax sp. BALOs_7]RZF20821.1 tetratricopeptide repeat protein [Halobacteriovorax vibrionivorans]TGD48205.1 tetratricopeptide repeat protein [Halobacteriovorax sp. Y22]
MTTQVAPNEGLNSELNSTELGAFIAKNKALVIGLILLIIGATAGYGIFSYVKNQQNEKAAQTLYSFETGSLEKFKKGEIDSAAMVSELKTILGEFGDSSAAISTTLLAVDHLTNKGQNQEAFEIISLISASNSLQSYFINVRKAVIQQDLKDYDGAIATLKELKSNDRALSMGRIELELGRSYLAKGDTASAKGHFERVLTLTTENVYKSLAKYHLNTIK